MIEVLVAAACYLTFFGNLPGIGTVMQVAALGLLGAAAAYALLLNKVAALRVSLTELILYAGGVTSAVLAVLGADQGPVDYSLGFLSALILISIVSRALRLERLLDIGAVVALLCLLTTIAIERGGVLTALSGSIGRNGLIRLTPLNNHPNLTGYIFGAGSILMIRRALMTGSRFERWVMIAAVPLSWALILGASARSSILALFASACVAVLFEFRTSRFVSFKWLGLGLVAVAAVGFAFPEKIVPYFERMLELDSSTRGIASGGSGRSDLWLRGLATLFDDPTLLAFGGGFRSSSSDVIGFSTESSYVTILLDSGLFIGIAVILVFLYSPIKVLRLIPPQDRQSSSLVLLAPFLTFLLVESIFNRYLLAVGNPSSLLTLLVLLSLSMRKEQAPAGAPQRTAPPAGALTAGASLPGAPPGGALATRTMTNYRHD